MAKDRLQGARFELKYIITEEVSLQIRDYIRSQLELDEHAVGKPNFSYPVHSLYLDSDDLKLYWSTINGDKNRFKMRLRFYDDDPDTPVFLEIKEKANNKSPVKKGAPVIKIKGLASNRCRLKKRAPVRREAVAGLLVGRTDDLYRVTDPKHFGALEEFCERMYELDACPKVHIAYAREAYMSLDDNSVRLTMDREIRAAPSGPPTEEKFDLSPTMRNPTHIWGQDVVLELKFTHHFPDLFRHLVGTFGLRQVGAAKYVDSVAALGEDLRSPPG